MKISLREEEGCSVLSVQGPIDDHNFNILKAGLSKLFTRGKNRIILHITESDNLSAAVLQELAILDVFARELSGKLLIASESLDLQTRAMTLARPPLHSIQPSVESALALFKEGDHKEANDFAARWQAAEAKVAALEAQLKLKDDSSVQAVRVENAQLKDKLKLLEAQVAELLVGKRPQPVFSEGFLEKCEALEQTVKQLSAEKAQQGAKV